MQLAAFSSALRFRNCAPLAAGSRKKGPKDWVGSRLGSARAGLLRWLAWSLPRLPGVQAVLRHVGVIRSPALAAARASGLATDRDDHAAAGGTALRHGSRDVGFPAPDASSDCVDLEKCRALASDIEALFTASHEQAAFARKAATKVARGSSLKRRGGKSADASEAEATAALSLLVASWTLEDGRVPGACRSQVLFRLRARQPSVQAVQVCQCAAADQQLQLSQFHYPSSLSTRVW